MSINEIKLKNINHHIEQCEITQSQVAYTRLLHYMKGGKIQLKLNPELYLICSSIAEKVNGECLMKNLLGVICIGPLFMQYLCTQLSGHIHNDDLVVGIIKKLVNCELTTC
tara:strand:+ start:2425 stop:2757 length:333 start_codon:yes stop_codon:yes gene_type:complete